MTRVLVPYDSSEQAEYAIEYAVASFEDATFVLLHVIEPFADHTGAAGYDGVQYRQQLENAEQMLENVAERYDAEIETVAQYGRPVHWIPRYVEEEGIDHVVMGSHGRDGAARLVLGSVAEAVARRSPVPVTVVRSSPERDDGPGQILVPFEGSEPAREALSFALEAFDESEITALYVAYPAGDSTHEVDTVFEILEDWDEERADHVSSILSVAEELAADRGRTVQTANVDGKPTTAIVEYAEDVDHVVIGSHGRDGLERLLLGSVAETVLRRAPVSVTVVK